MSGHATTEAKGLERENFGLPSLNLDQCSRTGIPRDWEIDTPFGDIIMGEFADETVNGEVMRGGIVVKTDVTYNAWRVVKVLKVGPKVSKHVVPGDFLMVPGDRGIPGISNEGKNLLFFNEERVFCRVVPRQ